MSKYIDIKTTNWQRFHFTEDCNDQIIINELKNTQTSIEGKVQNLIEGNKGFKEAEMLLETGAYMEPKQNAGNATIEFYNNGELLYSNEK